MPPACAVEIGPETVGEVCIWCNRTLSVARNAVHPLCLLLQNTVPVKACALIGEVVVNSDFDVIAPIGLDRGSRVLVVCQQAVHFDAIRRAASFRDREVVVASHTSVRRVLVLIGVC